MTKPRNRAAQDTTLVNLRALKKRITTLERLLKDRTHRIDLLEKYNRLNEPVIDKLRWRK